MRHLAGCVRSRPVTAAGSIVRQADRDMEDPMDPHDPARRPRHRPEPGIDGPFDVVDRGRPDRGARTGRRRGPPRPDGRVDDVTGLLVTPGLIDLHGHWYDGSPYGLDPMANLRGGVTTAVDAGTAGFSNFGVVPPAHDRDRAGPRPRLRPRGGRRPGHDASSASSQDIRYARPRETAAIVARAPRRRGRGQGPSRDRAPAATTWPRRSTPRSRRPTWPDVR